MLADVGCCGVGVGAAGGCAACGGGDVVDDSLEFRGDSFRGFVVGRRRFVFGNRGLEFCLCLLTRAFCFGFIARSASDATFFEEAGVTAADDFGDGGEIVLALDGFDFETPIVRAVGPAFSKLTSDATSERAADVGNVKTFDP